MSEPSSIVVLGDALVDEIVDDDSTTRHPGGSAVNVAIGLARLGIRATLMATIGDDDVGEVLRRALRDHDVPLAETRNPLGTGIARSERIAGEPRYSFSEAARSRDLDLDDEDLEALAHARVIAISGFPFDSEPTTSRLLAALEASKAIVAIDPNPRRGLIRDLPAYRAGFDRIASGSDLVKLGSDDLQLLTDRDDDELRAELSTRFHMLLATEGAKGASVWIEGARVASSPTLAEQDRVIDTMGAGDATFATFVAELSQHGLALDPAVTLQRAMRVAGATVAQHGALLQVPPSE